MSNKIFELVKTDKIPTNVFDLSHDVKMSGKMGVLYPVLNVEVVPGDTWKVQTEAFARFAPMIAPVMHRFNVKTETFFVPYRLLWDKFEQWITNTKDPITGLLPAFPTGFLSPTEWTPLYDYLGLPQPNTGSTEISAMHFAAYAKIWNEYYRDQNLQPEILAKLEDGPSNPLNTLFTLQRRAWERDYFTSCLPFAQKGEAAMLPVGNVYLNDTVISSGRWADINDHDLSETGAVTGATTTGYVEVGGVPSVYDPHNTLSVTPTTINDLRTAIKLQEWLEKNARGGTRYCEFLRTHYNVTPEDSRLQRPEYICGSVTPIVISEVLNTTGTQDAPQGNMAGHAIGVVNSRKGYYQAQEHGVIMTLLSIVPRTAYQQGVEKHWLKINDPTEYYFPSFAHLGEQSVKNIEVYVDAQNPIGDFGYIPRYAEYKFINSRVSGDFRTTLNFWHASRIFASEPALNSNFIQCSPRTNWLAVDDDSDYLWMHVFHNLKAIRPMPVFGTPKF